jgi:hypothetical protein
MTFKQKTETFETINQWQRATFPTASLEGVLNHIQEEWVEFQSAPTLPEKVVEAADLIILLSCFIDKVTKGHGAQSIVEAKMRLNRARLWNIQHDGTGRHA